MADAMPITPSVVTGALERAGVLTVAKPGHSLQLRGAKEVAAEADTDPWLPITISKHLGSQLNFNCYDCVMILVEESIWLEKR